MDYEKKYKEALERARIWKDKSGMPKDKQGILDDIFPELKESEDERIRKELIKGIYKIHPNTSFLNTNITREEALAWFKKQESLTTDEEKQGKEDVLWCIKQAKKYAKDENEMGTCWFAEQWLEKQGSKPQGKAALEAIKEEKVDNANKVNPKFKHGDRVRNKKSGLEQTLGSCIEDVYEGTYPFRIKDQDDWELVEHNTAWSKEDEERIKNILSVLDVQVCWDGATLKKVNPYQKEIDWLQSLKQKSWKPCKNQIIAFRWVLNNIPYNKHKEEISGLLDQIKDL